MKLDIVSSPTPGHGAGATPYPSTEETLDFPVLDDGEERIYDTIPDAFRATEELQRQRKEEGSLPQGFNTTIHSHRPVVSPAIPKPRNTAMEGATPYTRYDVATRPESHDSAPTPSLPKSHSYNATSHFHGPALASAMAPDDTGDYVKLDIAGTEPMGDYAKLDVGTMEPRRDYMNVGPHESAIPNPYESLPVQNGQNPYDTPKPTTEFPPEDKNPAEEEEYMEMGSPPNYSEC